MIRIALIIAGLAPVKLEPLPAKTGAFQSPGNFPVEQKKRIFVKNKLSDFTEHFKWILITKQKAFFNWPNARGLENQGYGSFVNPMGCVFRHQKRKWIYEKYRTTTAFLMI